MANFIESVKSNPIAYYVGLLVGVALLVLIVCLIIKNDKKKKDKIRELNEEKARIERHVDLEAMIAQMQEQEQSKTKDVDPVANFEQEQEEQAIISYQELVNAVKNENKEPINVINVSSSGDVLSTTSISRVETPTEPMFIDEVKIPKTSLPIDEEDVIEQPVPFKSSIELETPKPVIEEPKEELKLELKEVKEVIPNKETEKEIVNKFKNSEFISPIYGRQNSNVSYPKISSFVPKMDTNDEIIKIADDVDPNDEFLKTLREYRDN